MVINLLKKCLHDINRTWKRTDRILHVGPSDSVLYYMWENIRGSCMSVLVMLNLQKYQWVLDLMRGKTKGSCVLVLVLLKICSGRVCEILNNVQWSCISCVSECECMCKWIVSECELCQMWVHVCLCVSWKLNTLRNARDTESLIDLCSLN